MPTLSPLRLSGVETMRALAHPTRLRMLELLRREPLSASELARRLEIRFGSARFHLQQLVRGGLAHPAGDRRVRGGLELLFSAPAGGAGSTSIPRSRRPRRRCITRSSRSSPPTPSRPLRISGRATPTLDVVSLREVRLTPDGREEAQRIAAEALRRIRALDTAAGDAEPVSLGLFLFRTPRRPRVQRRGSGMSERSATQRPAPQPHVPTAVDGTCDLVHRRWHRDHGPRAACRIDERHGHRRRCPAARPGAPPPRGPDGRRDRGPDRSTPADDRVQRRHGRLFAVAAWLLPGLPGLMVLVATSSLLDTIFGPAGRSAIPALVDEDDLLSANAWLGTAPQHAGGDRPAAGWPLRRDARHPRRAGRDAASFLLSAALLLRVPPFLRSLGSERDELPGGHAGGPGVCPSSCCRSSGRGHACSSAWRSRGSTMSRSCSCRARSWGGPWVRRGRGRVRRSGCSSHRSPCRADASRSPRTLFIGGWTLTAPARSSRGWHRCCGSRSPRRRSAASATARTTWRPTR